MFSDNLTLSSSCLGIITDCSNYFLIFPSPTTTTTTSVTTHTPKTLCLLPVPSFYFGCLVNFAGHFHYPKQTRSIEHHHSSNLSLLSLLSFSYAPFFSILRILYLDWTWNSNYHLSSKAFHFISTKLKINAKRSETE